MLDLCTVSNKLTTYDYIVGEQNRQRQNKKEKEIKDLEKQSKSRGDKRSVSQSQLEVLRCVVHKYSKSYAFRFIIQGPDSVPTLDSYGQKENELVQVSVLPGDSSGEHSSQTRI